MNSNFQQKKPVNLPVPLTHETDRKTGRLINILLIALILCSFLLRLLYFNQNPPSLNQDEAMTGYNALAISKTLKDHWGYLLPAQMHGFGHIGIVSPLYTYLSAPIVGIMGLSETSIRLAAALFNTALIFIVFQLVRRFFKNRWMALMAALLFSLNPWSFHYSRVAHEAVIAPFMYMTLTLCFYMFLTEEKYKKFAILTGIVLGLSLYCYQNAWIISPAIMGLTGILHIKQIIKRYKFLLIAIGITLIIAYPLFHFYVVNPHPWMESRADQVSVLNKPDALRNFLLNYFSHFTINYLYLKGDIGNLPGMIGQHGMFLKPLIVLLPMGIVFLLYHLIARRQFRMEILLVFGLLLLYPFVAGITEPAPHALRAYTLVPVFHILGAAGWWLIIKSLADLKLPAAARGIFIGVTALPMVLFFALFLTLYYNVYPKSPYSFNYYQYGVLESAQYVASVEKKYDKVYFTSEANQPFIYVLFATQYDPATYMNDKTKQENKSYFGRVDSFGKYYFMKQENMPVGEKKALYVTRDNAFLKDKQVIHTISNPGNRIVFKIWE